MPPITSSIGVTTPPAGLGAFLVLGVPIVSYGFTDDLDPFDADPITDAGRMQPTGVVPADGSFVFCLGHDRPGFFSFFSPGDYAEVSQAGSFPAGNVLTFQARTRAPAAPLPAGFSWVASVLLDGAVIGQRTLDVHGSPIDWDWAVDVTGTGLDAHSLSFRLTLFGSPLMPPASPVVELEVPAFYVDNLRFFTGTAPLITNEVPVNGQGLGDGPPPLDSSTVDFDVFGLGISVDTSSLQLVINGAHAVVAGVLQTGFVGSIGPTGELLHASVAPAGGFASAQTVTVQATVALVGNVAHATRTWSFEVADTTPPLLALVQAVTPKQLRVTWTKPVTLVDPSGVHDGLNPSLYELRAIQPDANTPAVRGQGDPELLPTIVSVAVVDPSISVIDLFPDVDVTPGVDYQVTALGVEDLVGNFTTSVFDMPGFVLPWPQGRVFDLLRWLPLMNRVEDTTRDLLRFIRCLQEPANLLLYDVDHWTDILDVDRAPEPMLDAMLADLGNPFPFVLSVTQKRQLVRLLVPIFQQKGTAPGIINAIRFFLGITVTITTFTGDTMQLGVSELGGGSVPIDSDPTRLGTWILGPGTSFALYCFRVVSPVALSAAQIQQIQFIANYMKPGHTHLIEIVQPTVPATYDPTELGISELGVDWLLHV